MQVEVTIESKAGETMRSEATEGSKEGSAMRVRVPVGSKEGSVLRFAGAKYTNQSFFTSYFINL